MSNYLGNVPRVARREPEDRLGSVAASPLGPALLRALLEQLPVGILVADARGSVVYENEIAHGLRAIDSRLLDGPLSRALLLGETIKNEEIEIVSRDRSGCWITVSATPVRSALGSVDAAVVTFGDETSFSAASTA